MRCELDCRTGKKNPSLRDEILPYDHDHLLQRTYFNCRDMQSYANIEIGPYEDSLTTVKNFEAAFFPSTVKLLKTKPTLNLIIAIIKIL